MGKIRKAHYGNRVVEYDEDSPCLVCGESVIGASIGGTAICGSCDLGKCRYCGMSIFVMKESIDGGESKKGVLKHMEWHKINTPDIVKRINDSLRRMMDKFEEEQPYYERLEDMGQKAVREDIEFKADLKRKEG